MFSLPDFPYSYSALEPFLDAATLEIHHSKHHATYVKNLNTLLPDKSDSDLQNLLTSLDTLPSDIRQRVKNQAGGVYNHSFLWPLLNPKPSPLSPQLQKALSEQFGSAEKFEELFLGAASTFFGSGWTWLVKEKSALNIVSTQNQDCPLSMGLTPLLTVDLWEHSYYLKFQNRRMEYLEAFWNVINWQKVSELFAAS